MSDAVLDVTAPDGARAELILRDGGGEDIVYWLPALGVTARHYQPLADELARAGVGVALHEWRGAGSSSLRAARGSDWSYAELLADIAAGLAAVRARHPGARLWIGGHSLGAQLAALAMTRDTDLRGLMVVASGLPHWRTYVWWGWPVFVAVVAWFRLLAFVFGYFPGRRTAFAGNEAKSVIRDWSRSALRGRYRHVDTGADAALARLQGPVFALNFRDDRFVPRASTDLLLSRLPRMTPTRHDLSPSDVDGGRADHFSWMKAPAPVARRLVDFIRSRT